MKASITAWRWTRGKATEAVLWTLLSVPWVFAQEEDVPRLPYAPGFESRVTIPDTDGEIPVFVPANYSAETPCPVIYHYHGMNGRPNVGLLYAYTRGRDYILVGLRYATAGASDPGKTHETAEREIQQLRRVRSHLAGRLNIDHARTYLAGTSKGGWSTAWFGQMEIRRFSGLIILLAGRPRVGLPDPQPDAMANKPVYIGVGETEGNNLAAREAGALYRRLGAAVTFEEYAGKGHEVPLDAPLLGAWLQAHGALHGAEDADASQAALQEWYHGAYARVKEGKDPLEQYGRLVRMAADPRLRLCGRTATDQIRQRLSRRREHSPVREEWLAETAFERLIWQHYRMSTVQELERVYTGFQRLVRDYPETRYGSRAREHVQRLSDPVKKAREAVAEATRESRPAKATVVSPSFPTTGGQHRPGGKTARVE